MAESSPPPKKLYVAAFVSGAALTYAGLLIPQSDMYLNLFSLVYMTMLAVPILICRSTPGTIATFFGSLVGFSAHVLLHTVYFFDIVALMFRFMFLQLFAFAAMLMVESQTKLGMLVAGVVPAALYVSLSVLAAFVLAFTPLSQPIDWARYGSDSAWLLMIAGLFLPIAHEGLKERAENPKKTEVERNPAIEEMEMMFGKRRSSSPTSTHQVGEKK